MVDLMNEQDNMALVKFDTRVTLLNGLTQMTDSNKKSIINNINTKLTDYGGTNIFLGLQKGLDQIINDYSNGERICSIILLSDGVDLDIFISAYDLDDIYINNASITNNDIIFIFI